MHRSTVAPLVPFGFFLYFSFLYLQWWIPSIPSCFLFTLRLPLYCLRPTGLCWGSRSSGLNQMASSAISSPENKAFTGTEPPTTTSFSGILPLLQAFLGTGKVPPDKVHSSLCLVSFSATDKIHDASFAPIKITQAGSCRTGLCLRSGISALHMGSGHAAGILILSSFQVKHSSTKLSHHFSFPLLFCFFFFPIHTLWLCLSLFAFHSYFLLFPFSHPLSVLFSAIHHQPNTDEIQQGSSLMVDV